MIASPPAKPEPRNIEKTADQELGGVFLAMGSSRVWGAAFIAGLISLSIVSVAIFRGNDGQRAIGDWLLLVLFPILGSALLATFVTMFLAPHGNRPAQGPDGDPGTHREAEECLQPAEPRAIPARDDGPPPFADWIARESSGNEFGSLNVALDRYIETFDVPRQQRPNESKEIADYRLKLAILKGNLLADAQWKEAPELNEYVADLESLLAVHESAPAAEDEQPATAG